MFADEDHKSKLVRDPVAPAKRSDTAMKKVLIPIPNRSENKARSRRQCCSTAR